MEDIVTAGHRGIPAVGIHQVGLHQLQSVFFVGRQLTNRGNLISNVSVPLNWYFSGILERSNSASDAVAVV